jgi:mono/diheme cytochrome c family protein
MRVLLAAIATLFTCASAFALTPEEQRGLVFAATNCSICHAVLAYGESPLPIAPRFRDLHLIRDIDALAEPLHTGSVTEHPSMPHFLLDADQINDLIAYLHSLSPEAGSPAQDIGDAEAGLSVASEVCAACHAILRGEGTLAEPPPLPFEELRAYPFEDIANTPGVTATVLFVWMSTSHPTMPDIVLDVEEMRDVVAYILSLNAAR